MTISNLLNALFFPLLSGFLFYGFFNGTSHRAAAQPEYVRLFSSLVIGLPLLLLARGMMYAVRELPPDLLQQWVMLGLGPLLACSLVLGCAIWFATHAVAGTVATAHKLKSVVGIVVIVLAIAFLLDRALVTGEPQILGPDALALVAMLAWGAYWYAKFGAIGWGEALIRLSVAIALVAAPLYFISHVAQATSSVSQTLIEPLADSQAAAGIGTGLVAAFVGVYGAMVANLVYTTEIAETRYVLRGASQLERLFCMADSLRRMVLLTMEDGKVYVGMVKRVATRGNADPYIVLYPVISGHRTQAQEVAFTTFYQSIYDRLGEEAWEQFQKVLPMQRIVSAAYYDQKHHDTFFGSKVLVPYCARPPA